jgi:hypothetical protein
MRGLRILRQGPIPLALILYGSNGMVFRVVPGQSYVFDDQTSYIQAFIGLTEIPKTILSLTSEA